MTKTQVFITALRGLRNTLAAAVDQIDVVLDAAEQPVSEADREPGGCPHPANSRIATPTMGHPTRSHCTACGKDIE